MKVKQRTAILTLPTVAPAIAGAPAAAAAVVRPGLPAAGAAAPAPGAAAPAAAAPAPPLVIPMEIRVEEWTKFMVIDTAHLTNSTLVANPNTELTAPASVVLSDPALAGRYLLVATTKFAHSDMEVMVYYDNKYKDIFVLPTLDIYRTMSYLSAKTMRVHAYGVNFTGKEGDTVPSINFYQDIRAAAWKLPRPAGSVTKGGYSEHVITQNLRYSSSSTIPTFGLDFGTVGTLFPTLGFVADIHVFGYNSLFEWSAMSAGKQKVTNVGSIIVELPL